jgi:prepilin-type N-terminal cleavage/methylation domain-containing protein
VIRAHGEAGFTLVEMLVTMVITTIVFGATLSVLDVFQKNNRVNLLRAETMDNARNAMDRLARDLRNVAAPSIEASGALETAESTALVFQTTDTSRGVTGKNAANVMRVRYCLDDSTPTNEVLWRQVERWETTLAPPLPSAKECPDASAADYENSSRLVEYVVNRIGGQTTRPVFTYGPSSATLVSQIVSIEPTLYVDIKPGSKPGEAQLTSAISLRNENRQPIASFTAIQLGAKRIVQLNASESNDPDGLALAYKWWDNGALLSSTAQQFETAAYAEKTVHVFKLQVTDPGGLKSETSQTVTIK